MLKKKLTLIFLILILIQPIAISVFGEEEADTWSDIAEDMCEILDQAYDSYVDGDIETAKAKVRESYLQHYEVKGFEKITMMYISGQRKTDVEVQFQVVTRTIKDGLDKKVLRDEIDTLQEMVTEDANLLDGGKSKDGFSTKDFLASFLIIVREGAEAMLIVAAIIAFLVKVGSKKSIKPVVIGVILAVVASFIIAWLLQLLHLSGKQNEIFEAITIAIAVIMLFYVGNWFQKKSRAWENYIQSQVSGALEKGSEFSLAFTAFLAVFREGAETILFYKAIPNPNFLSLLIGFISGIVLLAVIYLIVRILSVKIPLKPFFLVTSILIYVMAVLFVGSIAPEFQEAGVMELTLLPNLADDSFEAVSWLGIYPYYETIIPQIIAILIAVYGTLKHYAFKKNSGRKSKS